MATTLVINTGSSSKKYALFRDQREVLFVTVTTDAADIRYAVRKNDAWLVNEAIPKNEYRFTIERVLASAQTYGCIEAPTDITHVGLRVVAPGSELQRHQIIDELYLSRLRDRSAAAPLHVPPVLHEIDAVRSALPMATLVAASDTAFHSTMPERAAQYSIPASDASDYDVKRFGYHGLSVASVVRRIHAVTGHNPDRHIICHLGSGASITAVQNGESVDTSMGFSPGSGLPMASRAGDIESGAVLELMRTKKMGVFDAYIYLQTRGGLHAMAGTPDFRFVLEQYAKHDSGAVRAMETFAYYVRKYIGAYMAALGGVDCLTFTATAGERSPVLRALCMDGLTDLGIELDADKNDSHIGRDGTISTHEGPVTIAVVCTEEMSEIARIAEQVAAA